MVTFPRDSSSPPPDRRRWAFKDPRDTPVITLRQVLKGQSPIVYVSHDDDGMWQFLDTLEVPNEDHAEVADLEDIVKLDPGVEELADLPRGWIAHRPEPGAPWVREREEADVMEGEDDGTE